MGALAWETHPDRDAAPLAARATVSDHRHATGTQRTFEAIIVALGVYTPRGVDRQRPRAVRRAVRMWSA
jgi:hypothetical protein